MTHLLTARPSTFPEPPARGPTGPSLGPVKCPGFRNMPRPHSGPEPGNPVPPGPVRLAVPNFFSSSLDPSPPRARFGSAVLQLQIGHPLVPTAALLAEAADALQGLTLERLDRRVLQNRKQTERFRARALTGKEGRKGRGGVSRLLTVTRRQCRSRGSVPTPASSSSNWVSRVIPDSRRMLTSLSQQNAWRSVKWICSAMSPSSSSSVASTHRTTLSGSLRGGEGGRGGDNGSGSGGAPRRGFGRGGGGTCRTYTFMSLADS